ncbi:hypothetical protein Ccrd_007819 [Cynara cardunculus var. scolymus]|uniref:Uncharacterized protein n=1 Tax=Cynara cardunculus var. scolymus TaxID=59895 RepID=A0A103XGF2_CYNCS|nr:hypothetical protein Ccrd_007819 [Cynara cardunculus var. scolymus]
MKYCYLSDRIAILGPERNPCVGCALVLEFGQGTTLGGCGLLIEKVRPVDGGLRQWPGATIGDMTITVTLAPDYQLPPDAIPSLPPHGGNTSSEGESAFRKAEDVVSSMFAKGFVLGKDVVSKAKSFDEKHGLTSTASAKVTSFDKKIGFTEKVSTGTSIVNEKVKEVDQKLQVSEKAKSAFAAAEQTVSNAGSAIMKNRYVFTSAAWVTGAFNKVAKAASEVGQQTKEKVGQAEDEQKHKMVDDFAQVHLSESPKAASVPTEQQPPPSKPAPVQGLIL